MLKFKRNRKLKALLLSLLLVALLVVPSVSVLAESISRDNIIIESGETLEKTSFLSGSNVRVDGNINGTTFIAASNIEVNGTIEGDLFIAGQSATISGTVRGSVFFVGQDIIINGTVENTIYLAGATLKVQAQTNGSAFLAGQTIYLEEESVIKKDAFMGASTIYQNGTINGDLSSSSESISIRGKIGGDLNYSSQQKADFLNGSEVVGETTWEKLDSETVAFSESMYTISIFVRVLLSIAASLIVWLFVKWIRPTFWPVLAKKIGLNPIRTGGFGALAVVVIPIVSILLMVTIIGIPLSFIMLSLYGMSLYVSKIILSVFIGLWFQKRFDWSNAQSFWLFLLGLIILTALGVVPIVGMVTGLVIASFGVGSIVLSILDHRA
ncbi:polymer-forming cytoskeletal protein [Carnobacterium funditum]|uniref:polymer-forming cytoskeletal protein n=1 Tax=Carnobacterium funditum TaxID=2752 RepID=UPI000554EF30|nr:polymer-forming cytoskeletal protein [Carnobacterium funditum]